MSRSLCHYNDQLVAEGKRKGGCAYCIANDIPGDSCGISNMQVMINNNLKSREELSRYYFNQGLKFMKEIT